MLESAFVKALDAAESPKKWTQYCQWSWAATLGPADKSMPCGRRLGTKKSFPLDLVNNPDAVPMSWVLG